MSECRSVRVTLVSNAARVDRNSTGWAKVLGGLVSNTVLESLIGLIGLIGYPRVF